MGVWIETLSIGSDRGNITVTPYVGVWIETQMADGLIITPTVTPYVGVWIETWYIITLQSSQTKSLLMWECGLKQADTQDRKHDIQSLLMWECGLKPK